MEAEYVNMNVKYVNFVDTDMNMLISSSSDWLQRYSKLIYI